MSKRLVRAPYDQGVVGSITGVAILLVIVECQFKKVHILTQSSDTGVLKNSLLIDHLETAANANSCQLNGLLDCNKFF